MLQISAGRFFRPDISINERTHRRTVYSNGWLLDQTPVKLPVGTIIGSTEIQGISTAMLEAVDRLEAKRPDGTDDFLFATGGDELIDDIAYVMTFALNRTFSRNHDQVHRLVLREDAADRRGSAASLFPGLFEPQQVIHAADLDTLKQFMNALLTLAREDFVRVMRVIRNTIDATRRAIDDPTAAYTDLVAALESLSDDNLTTPATWDRYDGRARKIIDAALDGENQALVEKLHAAVLEAERVGLKRRFVSSTLARVSEAYYRNEAVGAVRPPQSADLERMLSLAYDIRSRKGHVLEDLGDEAWVFTDGAETVFEPTLRRILTLAGLWRLVRHVVKRFVADAPKTEPEPWDYRKALPGIVRMQLAPQYWVWQSDGFDAQTAEMRLNGVAEAFIAWGAGHSDEGIDLTGVIGKVEKLVPSMPDGAAKAAMVAIYALWHDWTDPKDHSPGAMNFLDTHADYLEAPSPIAFTVGVLSNRGIPEWTVDEWAELATARRTARTKGKETPLPTSIDVLLQLTTADELETAGRHDEAVGFAANAVEECPGHEDLLLWEKRLIAGDHDPNFNCHKFLYGKEIVAEPSEHNPSIPPDESCAAAEEQQG
ncbi:hypothetical protein [Rhodococcus sp. JT-3]|uniref:hypothetical protein n=1 Tax=Rhodococcus sp. JT-3 TaxID=1973213 RepID=UPI0013031625|nr:hypothetical protein [Rhodococcus sp. JT-3]